MKMMGNLIWKTLKTFVGFIGTVWGTIEIVGNFSATVKNLQSNVYFIVGSSVLVTIVIMTKYISRYFCHKKKIPGSDASICVKVGDITKGTKGSRLIGINNRLETRNDCIGRNSIHAQIIKKHGEERVKLEFERAKESLRFDREAEGYCFGEAFSSKLDKSNYVFLVMSEMYIDTHPFVSKSQLHEAVHHFFLNQLRIEVADGTLYCPIIGTGAGGSSLNQKDVVCEIVRQFVLCKMNTSVEVVDRIKDLVIVIWWKNLYGVDWDDIVTAVDAITEVCGNCNTVSS